MYTLRSLRNVQSPKLAGSRATVIMARLQERAKALGALTIKAKPNVVRKLAF